MALNCSLKDNSPISCSSASPQKQSRRHLRCPRHSGRQLERGASDGCALDTESLSIRVQTPQITVHQLQTLEESVGVGYMFFLPHAGSNKLLLHVVLPRQAFRAPTKAKPQGPRRNCVGTACRGDSYLLASISLGPGRPSAVNLDVARRKPTRPPTAH